MEKHNKERFTENLLNWYDEHARILPWRSDPQPYRVWVSEIMLQQTRVEAVKPYFDRFITVLPTLSDLAKADDDSLAKLWEGLGYYNRVRNMKRCAQVCVDKYGGHLPHTYDELCTLPGIGSYTAGAIASIAYKQCVPAVDGNVLRVFSRVLISEDDILKERTKKKFQSIIQDYIPIKRSDAFNQALMEIGALVCVPNSAPRCNICPLAQDCLGYQSGDAQRLPNKTAKKKRRIEKKTILIIVCHDKVLLHQRDAQGLLAGLYEFTTLNEPYNKKQIQAMQEEQYTIKNIISLHKGKHIFSHIEWHMNGNLMEVDNIPASSSGNWVTMEELQNRYSVPSAFKLYKDALMQYMRR